MVTDLLTRIQNAQKVKRDLVKAPYSNLDFAVAEILAKNGWLESAAKKGRMPKRVIELKLKYDQEGKGVISGVKFLSKPSRRLYAGHLKLRPVRQNYGTGIISTPKGLMTYREARKAKVGGQLMFEIW